MSGSDDEQAFAAAREVCRRHARSFYFASHFLPRERRMAAYAVYAFCRQIDDAVDEAESIETARANLSAFERRLERVYADLSLERQGEGVGITDAGATTKKVGAEVLSPTLSPSTGRGRMVDRAFAVTVQRYAIPRQPFLDLLAGCEMDLTINRYATWSDLELYCYRVAGCVGLIMSRVFGLERDEAQRQAVMMGNAMQLTNILRDVAEDYATRGRVYLPTQEMERFGYGIDLLSRGIVNTSFIELMRFQIARARSMFNEAADGLCWLANDGSRLTATTMAVIYSGILDAIEQQKFDVFSRRARLTLPQKIARLPKCWRLSRRGPDQPLPRVFG